MANAQAAVQAVETGIESDYRKVTDALAGALDRLHAARVIVDAAQVALSDAQAKYAAAQEAARTVQEQLSRHLAEVLPVPNRRP